MKVHKLKKIVWPPDFDHENERRKILRSIFASVENPREIAAGIYADDPAQFINDWCITYDPRNPLKDDPRNPDQKLKAKMPFIPFAKQRELAEWLQDCMNNQADGLIEKSRDMGATWMACGFSVWMWLYVPGAAVGWGSRKEALVDRLGDPSSIFQKIRLIITDLPTCILPQGFDPKLHSTFMKVIGPHGASITGESGDNIGRGGRTTIYFKDESAHYERPELIEASLGDNTDCQIDISSVNGPNNIFHRKRHSGSVKVFVLDWRDHPGKDPSWYDARREKAETQGLSHVFAQEVDRDYNSSVEGVLIPGIWVKAAIDAHIRLPIKRAGKKRAAFDVADEGGDVNAVVAMHGVVLTGLDSWGEGDTGESTAKAFLFCEGLKTHEMVYDSVGVGAGAKAAARTAKTPVSVIPYNGVGVIDPKKEYVEGKKNEDMFSSGSAQDWWLLRDRFLATYNAVVKGMDIPHDKLISLPSDMPLIQQLQSELSQITRTVDGSGRIKIVKTPPGTKSPNLADALKMVMSKVTESTGPNIRTL